MTVGVVPYGGSGDLPPRLQALGATVVVFPTLTGAADALAATATPNVLVVPLTITGGDDGSPPEGIVLVIKNFRLPAVIRPTMVVESLADRFAEILRGPIDARRVAAAVIRAAAGRPAVGHAVRGETVA